MPDVRRRELIALLGGAGLLCAAKVRRVSAQQPAVPVIGFLHPRSRVDTVSAVAAFRQGLREGDFIESVNLAIEYRFADGQPARLPALAADLVERHVAVIAAGPRCGEAAKAVTTSIPIVFLSGGDPVKTGLVASLNRPGGNLTGVNLLSLDLETKRVGLLRDLLPLVTSVAVLADSTSTAMDHQVQQVRTAARNFDMAVRVVTIGGEQDYDAAFAAILRENPDALIVTASANFLLFRDRLAALATRHKLPSIYELREYAESGGLLSYGPSNNDAWRQIGTYTARILKGEKPANLPIPQPTKFEFVINMKTAKTLGLEVPPKLLALADEVIE